MAKKKKSHYHADMLSVEEAREKILREFNSLDEVRISLNESLGCVISKDIISNISVPPWNNSAMDGYAIILEDVKNASDENIIYLDVIEKIAAGELPEKKIISGQSARIMTGAPIPEGSNAVVPFEDTDELSSTSSDLIGIKINVENFENIRKKGEDISKGDLIIKKGVEITPAVVGVLASIGVSTIDVFRRPKIGILSTGNELIEPDQSIKDGKIYNSNTFTISSLTKSFGANPVTQAHSLDTIEDLEKKLNNFEDVDLIVTSAGVSKGDYDVVKDVLSKNGDMNFWSVNMRPAKPLAFGKINIKSKSIPLLGLPGNPVSAMIAFEKFGRYAIDKMMGKKIKHRPIIKAVLQENIYNDDGRRLYARVKVEKSNISSEIIATPLKNQSSGVLTSMFLSNGLAICPSGTDILKKGQEIDVEMFGWNEEISEIIN
ncbi:MAG: gephyrin-like molybdotransferase Glp [Dehalococcoidia bacterium]|nr:MAG: molybdopterin molybdenumtransferase MoeA [Chloroflexota bacterium]|tara:strand:- start:4763 stop:6061 length:1299 start_codon:yes stop_codon:yes gene_type:complete